MRVPAWVVMAVTLVLPIVWLIHYRGRGRGRRNTVNFCPCCDYDLRATPTAAQSAGRRRLKRRAHQNDRNFNLTEGHTAIFQRTASPNLTQ